MPPFPSLQLSYEIGHANIQPLELQMLWQLWNDQILPANVEKQAMHVLKLLLFARIKKGVFYSLRKRTDKGFGQCFESQTNNCFEFNVLHIERAGGVLVERVK